MKNSISHACRRFTSRLALTQLVSLIFLATATAGGLDSDGDGVTDVLDNCVTLSNATQTDTDSDGWGNRCDPDFNNDSVVNFADLDYLRQAFFTVDPDGDLNDDGFVNFLDLEIIKSFFLSGPGPAGYAIWINPGSGQWTDATNWHPAAVPPPEAFVTVDQPGTITVTYSPIGDSEQIAGLVSEENLTIMAPSGRLTVDGDALVNGDLAFSFGILDVTGDLTANGGFTMTNGELVNATVKTTSDTELNVIGDARFTGLTITTDVNVADNSGVIIDEGLTLVDSTIVFGHRSGVFSAAPGVINGTGEILAAGGHNISEVLINGRFDFDAGITFRVITGTLTLQNTATLRSPIVCDAADGKVSLVGGSVSVEAAITIRNGCDLFTNSAWTNRMANVISVIGGDAVLRGNWQNFGTIEVTNGNLQLGAPGILGDWSNSGVINVVNTPLALGGQFTLMELGNLNTDGPIDLIGRLDNSGQILDLDTLPGTSFSIAQSGSITGGEVIGSIPLLATDTAISLFDLTLSTDLVLQNATVTFRSNITLNNVDIRILGGELLLERMSLQGNGSIQFGDAGDNSIRSTDFFFPATISSGITILTNGNSGSLSGSLIVQATIIADGPSHTLTLGPDAGTVVFQGPVNCINGCRLESTRDWENAPGNTISSNFGELILHENWTNFGTIEAVDSLVELGNNISTTPRWDSPGVINLINSPTDIGGTTNLANLYQIASDLSLRVVGAIDNTATVFNLDDFIVPGLELDGCDIIGGTVSGSQPLEIQGIIKLIGVNLATDLIINNSEFNSLAIEDGLTLDNSLITLDAADTGVVFGVFAGETQTLGGNGEILFAGPSTNHNLRKVGPPATGGVTLTIGPDVVIRTVSGGGFIGSIANPGQLDNIAIIEGTVISDVPGQKVVFKGDQTQIAGNIIIENASIVESLTDVTSFTPTANLDVKIGAASTGLFVTANNLVSLAGAVNFSLTDGFVPGPCEAFEFMQYPAFDGAFNTVTGPDLGGGETFSVVTSGSSAVAISPGCH